MKNRVLSLLLILCIFLSMVVVPVSGSTKTGAITGESAVGQDYSFCGDTGIRSAL